MPRKTLIRSTEFPYHVTARANNREPFPASLELVWSVFGEHFVEMESMFQTKVHGFVLMPNHFHLLIATPAEDLGEVMQYLMRSVTKTLNAKTKRSGRIFGAKYHWSLITTTAYFDCALKYIYRNPVRAGLLERVEGWPYSTLQKVMYERSRLPFMLSPPLGQLGLVPGSRLQEYVDWLNTPFQTEHQDAIQMALRRTTFLPSKDGRVKRGRVALDGFRV